MCEAEWFSAVFDENEERINELKGEFLMTYYQSFPYGDAMCFAAYYNKPKSIRILLSSPLIGQLGVSEKGTTALMYAAMTNAVECVDILLHQCGLQSYESGLSALMLACIYDFHEIAALVAPFENSLFLINKIKKNQTAKLRTALDICVEYKSYRCLCVVFPFEVSICGDQEAVFELYKSNLNLKNVKQQNLYLQAAANGLENSGISPGFCLSKLDNSNAIQGGQTALKNPFSSLSARPQMLSASVSQLNASVLRDQNNSSKDPLISSLTQEIKVISDENVSLRAKIQDFQKFITGQEAAFSQLKKSIGDF